jgi:hypothetical protein
MQRNQMQAGYQLNACAAPCRACSTIASTSAALKTPLGFGRMWDRSSTGIARCVAQCVAIRRKACCQVALKLVGCTGSDLFSDGGGAKTLAIVCRTQLQHLILANRSGMRTTTASTLTGARARWMCSGLQAG